MDGLETADFVLARQAVGYYLVELSVVIVSYNVRGELRQCLSGLLNLPRQWEVIIVDNRSGDGTPAMLRKKLPFIKCIENQTNLGFARAANQGIRESQGEYVLLLNPDTQVDPESLREMVDFMERNPRVGILGCQIVNQDGIRQYSGRSFPDFTAAFFNSQSLLNRIWPSNSWSSRYMLKKLDLDKPGQVDWVSGSCMLVRRAVFNVIGYLDHKFFMFVEDVDFCRRAKSAGWKVFYLPYVKIVHANGRSVRQKKIKMLAEHHKSMYYYYLKHYAYDPVTRSLVFLGIWVRLGTVSLAHWMKN